MSQGRVLLGTPGGQPLRLGAEGGNRPPMHSPARFLTAGASLEVFGTHLRERQCSTEVMPLEELCEPPETTCKMVNFSIEVYQL